MTRLFEPGDQYKTILNTATGDINAFNRELKRYQAVNNVEKFIISGYYITAHYCNRYRTFSTIYASDVLPILNHYASGVVLYAGESWCPFGLFAKGFAKEDYPKNTNGVLNMRIYAVVDDVLTGKVKYDYFNPGLIVDDYKFSYKYPFGGILTDYFHQEDDRFYY